MRPHGRQSCLLRCTLVGRYGCIERAGERRIAEIVWHLRIPLAASCDRLNSFCGARWRSPGRAGGEVVGAVSPSPGYFIYPASTEDVFAPTVRCTVIFHCVRFCAGWRPAFFSQGRVERARRTHGSVRLARG